MRTLNTIDSCRLDEFFVGVEMDHEDLGMHSYFASCVTEIDFPTCIYITKRFLRLQTYSLATNTTRIQ